MSQNASGQPAREVTLLDIVIATRNLAVRCIKAWWIFAILFLVIGGFLGYKAKTTPAEYRANFTFMVNEEENTRMPGMSSILGQFGIGGRRGRYNLDKILELSRSRRIIQETMFRELTIQDQSDYLINHVISTYGLVDKWVDAMPEFEQFRFVSDSVDGFNELERTALLRVHRIVVGGENTEGLLTSDFSEDSGILKLSVQTIDQDLSLATAIYLFESLSDFYVIQSTERQQSTYDLISAKVDSISTVLSGKEQAYAKVKDANQKLLLTADRVQEGRLSREITNLRVAQAEALKNMEFADFSLKNATPFIQEIDRPISPLAPRTPSLIKQLMIAAVISFLIGVLWVLGKDLRARILQVDFHNNE